MPSHALDVKQMFPPSPLPSFFECTNTHARGLLSIFEQFRNATTRWKNARVSGHRARVLHLTHDRGQRQKPGLQPTVRGAKKNVTRLFNSRTPLLLDYTEGGGINIYPGWKMFVLKSNIRAGSHRDRLTVYAATTSTNSHDCRAKGRGAIDAI